MTLVLVHNSKYGSKTEADDALGAIEHMTWWHL